MVSVKLLAVAAVASLTFADEIGPGSGYQCEPATQACCDMEDDKCRTAPGANQSYCSSLKAQCYKDAGLCDPYDPSDCPGGQGGYHTSTPAYPTTSSYPGYPTSTPQGYPTTSYPGYPTSSYPGYPTSSYPGYPTTYPVSYPASTYPASTYPVTTYPASYPTGSYPVTTYPAGTGSYPVTYYTTTCPVTSYKTSGSTSYPVVYTTTSVITVCATCAVSTYPANNPPNTLYTQPAGATPPAASGTIQAGAAANIKPAMGMVAFVLGAAML